MAMVDRGPQRLLLGVGVEDMTDPSPTADLVGHHLTTRTDLPNGCRWDGHWRQIQWSAFKGWLLRNGKLEIRLRGKRHLRLEIAVHWSRPDADAVLASHNEP